MTSESPCRMKIQFNEPIDKVVILYAATHKANQDPNAIMFVSPLRVMCSCLCSQARTLGVKYFPVEGEAGVCTKKTESAYKLRYKCDMLATEQVCEYGFVNFMERTSEKLSFGGGEEKYACKESSAVTISKSADYSPDATFHQPLSLI